MFNSSDFGGVALFLLLLFGAVVAILRTDKKQQRQREGDKQMLAENRPVIIKTYRGSQAEATARFQADAAEMAARRYFPTSQTWAPGQWGAGAFIIGLLLCVILIGIVVLIYMLIVKPDGTLTVTYERRAAPIEERRAAPIEEKTCPRCAERIKAAALVCHFCGHEFAPEGVKKLEGPEQETHQ